MGEQLPEPQSGDDAYLEQAMADAERTWTNVPDQAARMIASQFHGGQSSALYSLTSCGAIDKERLRAELLPMYADTHISEDDKHKLDHLGTWIIEHEDRPPVEGWHLLWGVIVPGPERGEDPQREQT